MERRSRAVHVGVCAPSLRLPRPRLAPSWTAGRTSRAVSGTPVAHASPARPLHRAAGSPFTAHSTCGRPVKGTCQSSQVPLEWERRTRATSRCTSSSSSTRTPRSSAWACRRSPTPASGWAPSTRRAQRPAPEPFEHLAHRRDRAAFASQQLAGRATLAAPRCSVWHPARSARSMRPRRTVAGYGTGCIRSACSAESRRRRWTPCRASGAGGVDALASNGTGTHQPLEWPGAPARAQEDPPPECPTWWPCHWRMQIGPSCAHRRPACAVPGRPSPRADVFVLKQPS